jgi:pyruvate formate lyase activating enzyme
MKEALFYSKLENSKVQCTLCPHECIISPNNLGFCKVRKNIKGKLISLSYAKPASIAVDPREKKPLYYFYPGEKVLSIGTFGCNLACQHCQNSSISRRFLGNQIHQLETVSPSDIVTNCLQNNLHIIAYTYNEPTVFYEYMFEIAKLAHKHSIKNVIVSNGFINPLPLKKLLPFIDAANIDLKSFNPKFYSTVCSAKLNSVLNTLKLIANSKVHLEITILLIPSLNDNLDEFENMCIWIKENLGKSVPLHISRFFPNYKLLHLPPTAIKTILKAEKIAKKHLDKVHIGNV